MSPGLTNSSYALLGLLAIREMSGYDIKAFADDTLRHFWAISYGQIYPELRQLEELGLVGARGAPGRRPRPRVFPAAPGGTGGARGLAGRAGRSLDGGPRRDVAAVLLL